MTSEEARVEGLKHAVTLLHLGQCQPSQVLERAREFAEWIDYGKLPPQAPTPPPPSCSAASPGVGSSSNVKANPVKKADWT